MDRARVRLVEPPFDAVKPAGWTRFVCFSDTHGKHRSIPKEHLPAADVLLHAGDFTNIGELDQVRDLSEWLKSYPAKHKVVIAGNHDVTFQPAYYARQGERYHHAYDPVEVRAALRHCVYLEDEPVVVEGYRIYGSPWQPEFCDWAFNLPDLAGVVLVAPSRGAHRPWDASSWVQQRQGSAEATPTEGLPLPQSPWQPSSARASRLSDSSFRLEDCELQGIYVEEPEEVINGYPVFHQQGGRGRCFNAGSVWQFDLAQGDLKAVWARIPMDTDILMTHGPPHGIGDLCSHGARVGCRHLLAAVRARAVPVHLFGHIHEAYGTQEADGTLFVNASTCTLRYKATNAPVVFDAPPPEELRAARPAAP